MWEPTGLKYRFDRENLKWTDNREKAFRFDFADAEVIAAASRGEFRIEPEGGPNGYWLVIVEPGCYLAESTLFAAITKLGERLLTIWYLAMENGMSTHLEDITNMNLTDEQKAILLGRLADYWRVS